MRVELIYDKACPNVDEARTRLQRALDELGLGVESKEWERGSGGSPEYARRHGSPTILVNSTDVAPDTLPFDGSGCRLYRSKDGGLAGVPSVALIVEALRRAAPSGTQNEALGETRSTRYGSWAALPAVGTVLLPGLTCPACWPGYTALLATLGLGFANYTPYLPYLTVLFLGVAMVSLGHEAKGRRTALPLILGVLASLLVVLGRFVIATPLALYAGIALLLGVSLWKAWWPPRAQSCPACLPADRWNERNEKRKGEK